MKLFALGLAVSAAFLAGNAQGQSVIETDQSASFDQDSDGYQANVPSTAVNLLADPGTTLTRSGGAPATPPDGGGGTSQDWATLTDGSFGTVPPGGGGGPGEVAIFDNWILTYTFAGFYDITSIDVFTGWGDDGRMQPNVTVNYSSQGLWQNPACRRPGLWYKCRVIALIAGTNRPGSNTRKVVALTEAIYAGLEVPVRVLDLADLPAEIFSPTSYATKPAAFGSFSDAVLQSSGLHLVTPEYNGGMPGVLKYFIDMLKFPESFHHRPVCFVGLAAGAWGALRPVEQLQQIFGYRNAFIFPERVFLPNVGDQLDDRGQLKDPEILERLRKQAAGFVDFVQRLKGVRLQPA